MSGDATPQDADGRARAFNGEAKRLLRALAADVPACAPELGLLLKAHKLTKALARGLPMRLFNDAVARPHGAALRARDLGYVLANIEGLAAELPFASGRGAVEGMRRGIAEMPAERRDAVLWAPLGRMVALCEGPDRSPAAVA